MIAPVTEKQTRLGLQFLEKWRFLFGEPSPPKVELCGSGGGGATGKTKSKLPTCGVFDRCQTSMWGRVMLRCKEAEANGTSFEGFRRGINEDKDLMFTTEKTKNILSRGEFQVRTVLRKQLYAIHKAVHEEAEANGTSFEGFRRGINEDKDLMFTTKKTKNILSRGEFQYSNAAFGIVVCDSTGYLRYVLGKPCHVIFPLHAEIIAIHYACSRASDRGWFNATVESDSQLVISLACSETTPSWNVAALVDDIRLWENNMQLSFSWGFEDACWWIWAYEKKTHRLNRDLKMPVGGFGHMKKDSPS
nr:F-box domain, FBD domain, leucine-rich repeat domain, L domain-like protein [Tanacetum cinerariifolium]